MGILTMFGLVTAEEHAKAIRANENIIERASLFVADEEFASVSGLPSKVSLAIQRLKEARDAQFKGRQRYLTAEDRVETLTTERDDAILKYSEMSGICSQRDAEIVGLRAQLDAATEVINELKPLAEATKRRRANDANRIRPSRPKKVVEIVTPESSTVVSAAKTGKATGKPRTAIPAKVGKTSTAKISGDRPAKKAVRK